MHLKFDMLLSEAKAKTLDVVVKNDKSLFSREKTFMGRCIIALDAVEHLETGETEWYTLRNSIFYESTLKKLQD